LRGKHFYVAGREREKERDGRAGRPSLDKVRSEVAPENATFPNIYVSFGFSRKFS
jgi:hypothetical protein